MGGTAADAPPCGPVDRGSPPSARWYPCRRRDAWPRRRPLPSARRGPLSLSSGNSAHECRSFQMNVDIDTASRSRICPPNGGDQGEYLPWDEAAAISPPLTNHHGPFAVPCAQRLRGHQVPPISDLTLLLRQRIRPARVSSHNFLRACLASCRTTLERSLAATSRKCLMEDTSPSSPSA